MKIISNVFKKTLPFLLFAAGSQLVVRAQAPQTDKKAEKRAAIRSLVESQQYDFKATSVTPMSGRTRQLNSDYDLKVTKEAIVSYLPYFGRAYTAPMDPSQGGIQFTSTEFDYTVLNGKKGGWDVQIKPKDYRDVQQITLSISEDGYGTLQVTSTQRQPISFYGNISEIRPSKK
jgi:hypothetical protein